MNRTSTTKQDVEDLLRVEHGLFDWIKETEMTFGIPPEDFRSSYALDVIPFLRSGKTLCSILRILYPDSEGEPSTRTFLQICRNHLNMDPDDLFTEADVTDITSLYDIIVSLMKIVDTIIDVGEEMDINFPRKFNPPTEERRNFVSVEDELKYLHYVKIDVLDPLAEDASVSRVKGFDKSSSRTQSLMTSSFRSPMFGNGLDENFVDHIAENYARDNPNDIIRNETSPLSRNGDILGHLQAIEEFDSSHADIDKDNHFKEFDSDEKGGNDNYSENNLNKVPILAEENKSKGPLKLDIIIDNVPAVEEVKSAKAVKLFKRTLSQDDFATLEMKCREEIERIKSQLEQLYENSKVGYFDIWRELLILSGKKHGLKHAQRFQEPMKNIEKAFSIELQKNRELKRKCIDLRSTYEASELKKVEVEAMIKRVEEQNLLRDGGKSPSQILLEKLKRENKELRAERLNLDINITNQFNDMSRSVRTKNTSLLNSSRSYINSSISLASTNNQKPKKIRSTNGIENINQPITAVEHTKKKLEVMKMYLEEEQAKSNVLCNGIDRLNHEYKRTMNQIKIKKDKAAILRKRMAEMKESATVMAKLKNEETQKIKDIRTSHCKFRKDLRYLEAYNNMNVEMNRDVLDELDNDEKTLRESIEAKKKQLMEIQSKLNEEENKQKENEEVEKKDNNENKLEEKKEEENKEEPPENNDEVVDIPLEKEVEIQETEEMKKEDKKEEENEIKDEVKEVETQQKELGEVNNENEENNKLDIQEPIISSTEATVSATAPFIEPKNIIDYKNVDIADDEVIDINLEDDPLDLVAEGNEALDNIDGLELQNPAHIDPIQDKEALAPQVEVGQPSVDAKIDV